MSTINGETKKPAGREQADRIVITVKGQDGHELFFKVKRNVQLRRLMSSYCEKASNELYSIQFLFDGRRVQPKDTPNELGMENGDQIDAMKHYLGG